MAFGDHGSIEQVARRRASQHAMEVADKIRKANLKSESDQEIKDPDGEVKTESKEKGSW